jgi:hypothetical protein
MASKYKHGVKLVGYVPDRINELVKYLGQLFPNKGKIFFDEVIARVDAGDFEIIYQTNSLADAHRTAFTISSHGGQAEVIE